MFCRSTAGDAERIAQHGLLFVRELLKGRKNGFTPFAADVELLRVEGFTAGKAALVDQLHFGVVICCLLDTVGMTKGSTLDQQLIDLFRHHIQRMRRMPKGGKVTLAGIERRIINAIGALQHAKMPRTFDRKTTRTEAQIVPYCFCSIGIAVFCEIRTDSRVERLSALSQCLRYHLLDVLQMLRAIIFTANRDCLSVYVLFVMVQKCRKVLLPTVFSIQHNVIDLWLTFAAPATVHTCGCRHENQRVFLFCPWMHLPSSRGNLLLSYRRVDCSQLHICSILPICIVVIYDRPIAAVCGVALGRLRLLLDQLLPFL